MIIANWKMHKSSKDVMHYLADFSRVIGRCHLKNVYIAPPIPVMKDLAAFATSLWAIEILAQNIHQEPSGAFTGEVSIAMMQEVRASGALIGHSERRAMFNETDQTINEKILACQRQQDDFLAVLCIGESAQQRQQGETIKVLERQLSLALNNTKNKGLVIAYEPVWAIGTGNVATSEQIQETHEQIKNWCTTNGYHDVPVLYGGSVKPDNAESLLAIPEVDGLLVGSASLDGGDFARIVALWRESCD